MGLFDFLKRTTLAASQALRDPRELLAREVELVLRADARVTAVQRIPADFALKVNRGEDESTVYLEHLFAETREFSPDERKERITLFLSGMPDDKEWIWSDAHPLLRVAVRPCTYATSPAPNGGLMPRRAARAFVAFLDATLVIDEPGSLLYVTQDRPAKWGVSDDETFRIAMENTAAAAADSLELYSDIHGPVLHLPGEDVYASSRLLIPGWLSSMKDRVEGRPLAIIPERSMLFVGGDACPELVRWLAETAQREYEASTRGVSPGVYTVDDAGGVAPYMPTEWNAIANLVRTGHAKFHAQMYEDQRAGLELYYEKNGVDLYVAKLTLMQLADGRPYSYCAWVEGAEGLLPIADVVMATGGTKEDGTFWLASVPFEAAKKIGGPIWTTAELPFGPSRFRVSGAISQEQKAALLATSRPPKDLV